MLAIFSNFYEKKAYQPFQSLFQFISLSLLSLVQRENNRLPVYDVKSFNNP